MVPQQLVGLVREREEERRAEAEELGAEVEEVPLFLPTPDFMAAAEEEEEGATA
jgi:hypothetical protein